MKDELKELGSVEDDLSVQVEREVQDSFALLGSSVADRNRQKDD